MEWFFRTRSNKINSREGNQFTYFERVNGTIRLLLYYLSEFWQVGYDYKLNE